MLALTPKKGSNLVCVCVCVCAHAHPCAYACVCVNEDRELIFFLKTQDILKFKEYNIFSVLHNFY